MERTESTTDFLTWVSSSAITWARQSNRFIFERAEISRRSSLDLEIVSRARSDLLDETQYVCSVRSWHSSYSIRQHTSAASLRHHIYIRCNGRGSYARGKETGTFHTRQGFPAGHETSRKGPECVKRRPLALRAHPSLSSRPNSVRCLSPLLA